VTPAQWVVLSLGFTALVYIVTAVAYHFGARPGMALTFAGYTVANIGLMYDMFHSAPK
jgi:hypothetical protein